MSNLDDAWKPASVKVWVRETFCDAPLDQWIENFPVRCYTSRRKERIDDFLEIMACDKDHFFTLRLTEHSMHEFNSQSSEPDSQEYAIVDTWIQLSKFKLALTTEYAEEGNSNLCVIADAFEVRYDDAIEPPESTKVSSLYAVQLRIVDLRQQKRDKEIGEMIDKMIENASEDDVYSPNDSIERAANSSSIDREIEAFDQDSENFSPSTDEEEAANNEIAINNQITGNGIVEKSYEKNEKGRVESSKFFESDKIESNTGDKNLANLNNTGNEMDSNTENANLTTMNSTDVNLDENDEDIELTIRKRVDNHRRVGDILMLCLEDSQENIDSNSQENFDSTSQENNDYNPQEIIVYNSQERIDYNSQESIHCNSQEGINYNSHESRDDAIFIENVIEMFDKFKPKWIPLASSQDESSQDLDKDLDPDMPDQNSSNRIENPTRVSGGDVGASMVLTDHSDTPYSNGYSKENIQDNTNDRMAISVSDEGNNAETSFQLSRRKDLKRTRGNSMSSSTPSQSNASGYNISENLDARYHDKQKKVYPSDRVKRFVITYWKNKARIQNNDYQFDFYKGYNGS